MRFGSFIDAFAHRNFSRLLGRPLKTRLAGRSYSLLVRLTFVSVLLAGGIESAKGVDRTWTNGLGGSWTAGANWSGGSNPGPNDGAIFNKGSGTVTIPSDLSVRTLRMGSTTVIANATFNLNAHELHVTERADLGTSPMPAALTVRNGQLTIENLLTSDYGSDIVVESGGNLNLNGVYQSSANSNSTWTDFTVNAGGVASTGDIDGVGIGGTRITLAGGGKLTSGTAQFATAYGSTLGPNSPLDLISVSGAGSKWTALGNVELLGSQTSRDNYSRLKVQSGGAVEVRGQLTLGAKGQLDLQGGIVEVNSYKSPSTPYLYHTGGTLRINKALAAPGAVAPGSFDVGSGDLFVGGGGTPVLEFANGAYDTGLEQLYMGNGARGDVRLLNGSSMSLFKVSIGNGSLLTVDGGSTLTHEAPLYVGNLSPGSMTISAGGKVTSGGGRLGDFNGETATVTVAGSQSQWDMGTDDLLVGRNATATLTILDGATVKSARGTIGEKSGIAPSSVSLSGGGSNWTTTGSVYVGGTSTVGGGNGNLAVADGASMTTGLTLRIWTGGSLSVDHGSVRVRNLDQRGGTISHGSGTITVDGGTYTHAASPQTFLIEGRNLPERVFTNGAGWSGVSNVTVGGGYGGKLVVENGSQVAATTLYVGGERGHGTAIVRGAGASLTVASDVSIRGEEGGELVIENGGLVASASATVGDGSEMEYGSALINGAGSSWTISGPFKLGDEGTGAMEILGGAGMTSSSAQLGVQSFGHGAMRVSGPGSKWRVNGDISVGLDGTGILEVEDSGEVEASGTVTVNGAGGIYGDGVVDADVVSHGYVAPGTNRGAFEGTLAIDGNYRQMPENVGVTLPGTLGIGISSATSFDRLSVFGQASLAGNLVVTLDDSYLPLPGANFEILTATGGVLGDFKNYMLPDLPGGLAWQRTIGASSVQLSVVTPFSADFNGDGFVNGADLTRWKGAFGMTEDADSNFDGESDGADLLAWQRQLGGGGTAMEAQFAAPEPPSATLLVLAALAWRGVAYATTKRAHAAI